MGDTLRHMALTASLVLLACANVEDKPRSQTEALELTRIAIPALDSLGPEQRRANYAVSASGRIAFTTGFTNTNHVITVLDPSGRLLHRLAPRGGGPGELEGDWYVFMRYDGDTLVVANIAKQRLMTFAPDGRLINTTPSFRGGMPIRLAVDSSDVQVLEIDSPGLSVERIQRVSTVTGEARNIIDATDAMYDSLRNAEPWALKLSSLSASSGSTVVVADNAFFRFQAYDDKGRPLHRWRHDVEPRYNTEAFIDSAMESYRAAPRRNPVTGAAMPLSQRNLAQFELSLRRPLPQFSALAFDDQERLWVFGHDEQNLPVADIFAKTEHVERISLPCQLAGFFAPSMRGRYFLVLCLNRDLDSGVELRLYSVAWR